MLWPGSLLAFVVRSKEIWETSRHSVVALWKCGSITGPDTESTLFFVEQQS